MIAYGRAAVPEPSDFEVGSGATLRVSLTLAILLFRSRDPIPELLCYPIRFVDRKTAAAAAVNFVLKMPAFQIPKASVFVRKLVCVHRMPRLVQSCRLLNVLSLQMGVGLEVCMLRLKIARKDVSTGDATNPWSQRNRFREGTRAHLLWNCYKHSKGSGGEQ